MSIPTATPEPVSLASLVPNVPDIYVVLEANRSDDIGGFRVPNLTVYRDGTVLLRQEAAPIVARLTAAGLGAFEALVLDAGFLTMAARVPVDPTYAAGFTSYVITLRHDGTLIQRATSNAPAPGHRSEADAIIALVDRVIDVERVLPATAWAVPPSAAAPYVPSKLVFKVTTFDNPVDPNAPDGPTFDVAAVQWPFETPMLRFGNAVATELLGPGSASRCAVVTLEAAASIADAIAPAPWGPDRIPASERMTATLTWMAGHGHVAVSLGEMLPGETDGCEADGNWP